MNKYYILESIEGDSLNKRIIPCKNVGEAYRRWMESPINSIIVKEIEVQVVEK